MESNYTFTKKTIPPRILRRRVISFVMALVMIITSVSSLGVALGISNSASADTSGTIVFDKADIAKAALTHLGANYGDYNGTDTFACDSLVYQSLKDCKFTSIFGKSLGDTMDWYPNTWYELCAGVTDNGTRDTAYTTAVVNGRTVDVKVTLHKTVDQSTLAPGDIICWVDKSGSGIPGNGHMAVVVDSLIFILKTNSMHDIR